MEKILDYLLQNKAILSKITAALVLAAFLFTFIASGIVAVFGVTHTRQVDAYLALVKITGNPETYKNAIFKLEKEIENKFLYENTGKFQIGMAPPWLNKKWFNPSELYEAVEREADFLRSNQSNLRIHESMNNFRENLFGIRLRTEVDEILLDRTSMKAVWIVTFILSFFAIVGICLDIISGSYRRRKREVCLQ
jgi:hypothetical protein